MALVFPLDAVFGRDYCETAIGQVQDLQSRPEQPVWLDGLVVAKDPADLSLKEVSELGQYLDRDLAPTQVKDGQPFVVCQFKKSQGFESVWLAEVGPAEVKASDPAMLVDHRSELVYESSLGGQHLVALRNWRQPHLLELVVLKVDVVDQVAHPACRVVVDGVVSTSDLCQSLVHRRISLI